MYWDVNMTRACRSVKYVRMFGIMNVSMPLSYAFGYCFLDGQQQMYIVQSLSLRGIVARCLGSVFHAHPNIIRQVRNSEDSCFLKSASCKHGGTHPEILQSKKYAPSLKTSILLIMHLVQPGIRMEGMAHLRDRFCACCGQLELQ